jgi:Fe-S oxidoreductase
LSITGGETNVYNPKDIVNLVADNVRKTMSPFGIPKSMTNRWWKKMFLPGKGEWLLFTGMMYQFVPYIEKITGYLEKYEDSRLASLVRFAGFAPTYLSGIGLSSITAREKKSKADESLQNMAKVLMKSNVNFYYNPKLDFYSGILLYELGDQVSFVDHARVVAGRLNSAGVKKIITVDPHTTYALKVLYPRYTGESFDVRAYFELVDFRPVNGGGRVTLHDSCIYGRYLELSDAPRNALERLGVQFVDVRNSGAFTNCCGGPAESIFPSLAREVMGRRVKELQSTGAPIVAMCPICLGNLKKSGAPVEDLSTVMARCAERH